MNFPCPKCNAPDRGVLLFNLVAPCDTCSGIVPEKKKEKYTIHNQKELLFLGNFLRVALGCGPEEDRVYIQREINKGCPGYFWTDYCNVFTHKDYKNYPNDLCIVQWSE